MTRTLAALACVIVVAMTASGPIHAQADAPIRYTLRFPAAQTHYMEVEAVYPTGGRPQVELFMAVWTPGSYLIREYQRHVEDVAARGSGGALSVQKSAKNRWRVDTGGAPAVTVSYRVYGREMTVRNNWIEHGFAMLNGAPTFISLVDGLARTHEVRIELPSQWKASATALMPVSGQPHTYRAEDFDTLVDSPIILGNPVQRDFTVAGKRHVAVFEGDTTFFDVDRATADTQKIVEAGGQVMGGRFDYPHYYALNLIVDAGGGLEHKNSFLVMANRFTTRTRRAYLNYLGLVAHEHFHVWNIKRLRPIELGPFDYENENYTKALWIAEGFTDYYAGLLVKRPGISTRDEFFEELSGHIEAVQTTPGRLVTSADMSSFDTWIKQYRPDENTANTTINYYPKGVVIALLLDTRIRKATGGAKSLDDALRLAYERHAGAKGYTMEQFYQAMSDAAGVNLRDWFARTAESTDELDYTEALDWFGLRFRPVDARNQRAWLGATTRNDAGRLVVSQVRRQTPVHAAGLNVDDEILAIDDVRVRADGLAARLDQYRPGDEVSVLVARRDRLMRMDVTLGAEPGRVWRLEPAPNATEEQKRRLSDWIGE
ncbi:MAG TPA: PDZ domain-containing protein [Vicinamibacterales bacterium]|nr:PDZ domain-containing protein [Vicinamibacterales bacterium]